MDLRLAPECLAAVFFFATEWALVACLDFDGDVLAAAWVGAEARETALVSGAALPESVINGKVTNPAISDAICLFIDVDSDATPI